MAGSAGQGQEREQGAINGHPSTALRVHENLAGDTQTPNETLGRHLCLPGVFLCPGEAHSAQYGRYPVRDVGIPYLSYEILSRSERCGFAVCICTGKECVYTEQDNTPVSRFVLSVSGSSVPRHDDRSTRRTEVGPNANVYQVGTVGDHSRIPST